MRSVRGMPTPSRFAAVAAVLATAALLPACGGEARVESAAAPVTTTVTTPATSSAPPTTPTPPVTTVSATTAATPAGRPLSPAVDLPYVDAVPGLAPGGARTLEDAQEVVDILYQAGDPNGPAAVRRLERAGFSQGVLRDQQGTDAGSGIALLRTYALRLDEPDAARREVEDAVSEVQASTQVPSRDIPLGLPDSRAIRIDIEQPGAQVKVLFISFAVGDTTYGLQAFARGRAALPQAAVVAAAQGLHRRVSATP